MKEAMPRPYTAAPQTSARYSRFDIDAWDAQLGSVCGAFHTDAVAGQVTGSVSVRSLLGLDIANVHVSPAHILRNQQDVKRDGAAYYFLIGQRAAQAHIQHGGRSVLLDRGDLVLVDSSKQSQFIYTGSGDAAISDQISAHIPRQLLEGKLSAQHVGERIEADSDLAHCIWEQLTALEAVADLLGAQRLHTEKFQTLFLKAFTHLFHTDRHQKRFVQVMQSLLQEAGDPSYGVDHFAGMSASSRRTFFRIFAQRETSFGELLKTIRLLRFFQLCNQATHAPERPSVSALIFQAGFSDVSNFNHMFKSHFGVAPGAVVGRAVH
jgi:AraC family transcriptional activator of tynA and feaB